MWRLARLPIIFCTLQVLLLLRSSRGATTTPGTTSQALDSNASNATQPPFTFPTTTVLSTTLPEDEVARFPCATQTCALSDEWIQVEFENSTEVCNEAHSNGVAAVTALYQTCRQASANSLSTFSVQDCRAQYCEIFDNFLQTIAPTGGPEFYGGTECEPMLHFNRTLCEIYYRDAEVFCTCLCPTMGLVFELDGCQDEILPFLFFGRRGMRDRYPLNMFCSQQLAEWLSPLADPRLTDVDHEVITNPEACSSFHIPYPEGHFWRILREAPYDYCPWRQDSGEVNILECGDGTRCDVDRDSWGCCTTHHQRLRCPANYPVMCGRELACSGQTDFCCEERLEDCEGGAERPCSPLVAETMPEWFGIATPGSGIGVATTTTDPWLAYLARTTQPPPSVLEDIKHIWPPVLAALALLGIVSTIVICVILARKHHLDLGKFIVGPNRLLIASQKDPVEVYKPSGELPASLARLREAALPPKLDWRLVEAARADHAATEKLKDAVDAIHGLNGARLGIGKEGEDLPQYEALEDALSEVRKRNLEGKPKMVPLVRQGDRWLHVRRVERALDKACNRAEKDLPHAGKQLTLPASLGGHGFASQDGQDNEEYLRQRVWDRIEALRDALRSARAEGAADLILARGDKLVEMLLARTVELPAECCVLDPDGNGVKILPNGRKRATWDFTGDPYTYMESGQADALGDDMPTEDLDAAPVDPARPICAAFLKGRCHMGSECAWRHGRYIPGDTVREPVLQELDF